uniref:lysozyme n=1 Tax=Paracoccus sp. TRP TaxID=412597 RepID=UPI000225FC22
TITKADARTILTRDLPRYEADVTRLVRVPLNENQFGALVSFTYNLGAGNLTSSTLLRKLNAGDYAGAAAEFPTWNKAGGKVLNGLVRRRAAERALFEKPVTVPERSATTAPSGGIVAAIVALLKAMFGGK